MKRIGIILNAITQLIGAVSGRTLNANESLSGSSWRTRETPTGAFLYKWLNRIFFWQKDHCKEAALRELVDAKQLLKEYGFDNQD